MNLRNNNEKKDLLGVISLQKQRIDMQFASDLSSLHIIVWLG